MSTKTKLMMAGVPVNTQCWKALEKVLERIRDHETIGWHMGYGTQTFNMVTEAYAAVTGCNLDVVRDTYAPTRARDPRKVRVAVPGQIYADQVKPAGRTWDDMEEFYREEAVRAESNLLGEYGIEIEAEKGDEE
jgi:hypothetical protein